MSRDSHIQPENTLFYIIRQVSYFVSLGIHISLFWEVIPVFYWVIIFALTTTYPLIIRYAPRIKDDFARNLLLDTAINGLFLGLWGLNPYLITAYIAGTNAMNVAAGGVKNLLKGLLILGVSALIGAIATGFYYRSDLPQLALYVASFGLLAFVTLFGFNLYRINSGLKLTQRYLKRQQEELIRQNKLAIAVNTHLDINTIMKSLMETIEGVYPFEAMYILSFPTNKQHQLQVTGIYGSAVTGDEYNDFRSLQFDMDKDKDSMFVQGLIKKKVVYIPNLSQDMVSTGAAIDQKLFKIKPSRSIAYFPIFINNKVVSGACFINYQTPFSLSNNDILRIKDYLIQAGTAIRNATLFDELSKTKELAITAQIKAETSEETKSRFLANMSHEIRTPLTAVLGYSEAILEENISEEEQKKFTGYILRSGKHLLSMINDILDISKIEAKKIEIEKTECDIFEILCDIESYMLIKTKEKNLSFTVDIQYPLPKVFYSDPTRLKQVLLNLCNNAVKFTEDGGITISLRQKNPSILEVNITDTGIGISDTEHEKIFSAFDQADTSTTRLFGGTGLGLYISKNLSTLLGGNLTVSSNKGCGSTFCFTTPIILTNNAAVQKNQIKLISNNDEYKAHMTEIKDSKTFGGPPKLSGRILIAEDNKENQDVITRLIQQTTIEFDIASNGLQAVESAKNTPYDIIFLDMQMPIMGGREAAKNIKTSGVSTPIIAFTANVMKHQIDEYRELGFADVLEKPIIKEKLFSILKSFIEKKQAKSTKRVLIVEDNDVNQMILFRYVTKVNDLSEVSLAKNGKEALAHVQKNQFDLILMDMEMPIMGGLEATKRMRKMGCDTNIYMVSGNTGKDSINKCLAAGATGHLNKPIDKAKILNIIESSLLS